jgi:hypothetical protein
VVLTAQEAKVKQQLSMPVNETGAPDRRMGCLDRNGVRQKNPTTFFVKIMKMPNELSKVAANSLRKFPGTLDSTAEA